MKKNKGFTLIELLVVIAIIGILAAIVLVSLRNAREKARDARIQGDISQLRATAEMIYSDNGNYDSMCGAGIINVGQTVYGTNLNVIQADINTNNGAGGAANCYASLDNFCLSAQLNSGQNYCISAAGRTGNDTCTAQSTVCD